MAPTEATPKEARRYFTFEVAAKIMAIAMNEKIIAEPRSLCRTMNPMDRSMMMPGSMRDLRSEKFFRLLAR